MFYETLTASKAAITLYRNVKYTNVSYTYGSDVILKLDANNY